LNYIIFIDMISGQY